MALGETLLFLVINLGFILGLFFWQKQVINKALRGVRAEARELEDLVTAIIEELEATTGIKVAASSIDETAAVIPPELPETNRDFAKQVKRQLTGGRQSERILELADEGFSVAEIARELGTGHGEVQLVLGIHKKS